MTDVLCEHLIPASECQMAACQTPRIVGSFADWMASAMRTRGLSRYRVAELAGVDRSTITRLLAGDRSPTLDTATRIVEAITKASADCDVCGRRDGKGVKVRRFSLTTQRGSRGAGSMFLCGPCWARIAKPRMKPRAARSASDTGTGQAPGAIPAAGDSVPDSSSGLPFRAVELEASDAEPAA